MNLENKTIHTVGHPPALNTQKTPLPKGVYEDAKNGFMGQDLGVNGRMGDVSKGVTNEE